MAEAGPASHHPLGQRDPGRRNAGFELAFRLWHRGKETLRRIPRFILFLYAVDVALALAFLLNGVALIVAAYLQGHADPPWKLLRLLHIGQEQNIPTWYASIQLFVLASLLGLFSWRNFDRSTVRSWLLAALPLIFLVMSIDEIVEIHEYLGYKLDFFLPDGTRENTPVSYSGIWGVVIAGPFLALLVCLLLSVKDYLLPAPGTLEKFLIGAGLLVLGAGGLDMAANFVEMGTYPYFMLVFCEELLEMLGVTTMLWGAFDLLRACNLRVSLDALPVGQGHGASVRDGHAPDQPRRDQPG